MEISDGAARCLQDAVNEACNSSPRKGARVAIYHGKHKDKAGVVFWHGKDKFDCSDRYGNWAQAAMGEAIGLYGYRIGVRTDEGDKFFTKAEFTIEPCEEHGYIDKTRCTECDSNKKGAAE